MADVRRFNPHQPRDPGGKDGGKWIKNPVSDFVDELDLTDRIELDDGDRLGSTSRVQDETGDADLNWAVVFTKEYGPEVRVSITDPDESDDWTADLGGAHTTTALDVDSVAKFRTQLEAGIAEADRAARDADAAWKSGKAPTDPRLLGTDPAAAGEAIDANGADLSWEIYLNDDEPTSWQLQVSNEPETDGIWYGPKLAKYLLGALGKIEDELRGPPPTGEATAVQRSARRTRTPRRAVQSRYSLSQKRDPDGKWGDGVPGHGFDLNGLTAVQHLEGTFGDLAMGVDAVGDVRLAFHEGGNARELDLSAGDVGEMGDALARLAGEREDLDGDLPNDELVDDQWFGDEQQHRVALYGSGVIQVTFGAEEEDPWTLSLDPPDDENGDDVETFLDFADAVLAEAATRSRHLRTEVRGTDGHVFEDGICISCADDEPDGPLDEQAQALLAAISELGPASRAFNPAVHPRNPKGAAGGGRFRSNVDKLKDAIKAHKSGDGKGDPFEGFDREQLRRVAKARGIELKRGEGRDSIAAKLLDHLNEGDGPKPKAEEQKPEPKKRQPRKRATPAKQATPKNQASAHTDRSALAAITARGTVTSESTLSGGAVSDTRIRTYADGSKTVWKSAPDFASVDGRHQADAEELSSLVAQALGLRAPAVVRGDERSVHMAFVDEAKTPAELDIGGDDLPDTDAGRMMGLLDLLISNSDRNTGNVLIPNDGGPIVPIDHGLAFRGVGRNAPGKPTRDLGSPYTRPFYSVWDQAWTDNDLTPGDITAIRKRLQRQKAEFDRLGRGDWFDHMTGRLDAIEPYAKGTTSRLPAEVR